MFYLFHYIFWQNQSTKQTSPESGESFERGHPMYTIQRYIHFFFQTLDNILIQKKLIILWLKNIKSVWLFHCQNLKVTYKTDYVCLCKLDLCKYMAPHFPFNPKPPVTRIRHASS